MWHSQPRIIIAALKGGSGKTILSLGLTSALCEKGNRVAPFKKGPDFIDAAWLALAARRPCHNLDSFMMTNEEILESFVRNSEDSDLSLMEGNRGLFDGLDLEGCCSTAELARLLRGPVILIVDVTMVTRTVAALVLGCTHFDRDLTIAGVILNRVGSPRQEELIRSSIEYYCDLPVIGAVPRAKDNPFPERHMGLVPYQEREHAEKAIARARAMVMRHLDLDAFMRIALQADLLPLESPTGKGDSEIARPDDAPRIGFIRDHSFWFYYPENLDQFEKMGAVPVEINAMQDRVLPPVDALYIGGGFPETQAQILAGNQTFRESLKQLIEDGLPVYAECGGLLYLGENLIVDGNTFPMVGALPLSFSMEKKPQGHGYTILETDHENPYYPVGEKLRGHEFHYSRPVEDSSRKITSVFKVIRGRGLDGRRDGLCRKNLLATYTHIHAAGNHLWGQKFYQAAVHRKDLLKRRFGNAMK